MKDIQLLKVTSKRWVSYKDIFIWEVKLRDIYGKKHTIEITSKEKKPIRGAKEIISNGEANRIHNLVNIQLIELQNKIEHKLKPKK